MLTPEIATTMKKSASGAKMKPRMSCSVGTMCLRLSA
jgi:hypothetical protein